MPSQPSCGTEGEPGLLLYRITNNLVGRAVPPSGMGHASQARHRRGPLRHRVAPLLFWTRHRQNLASYSRKCASWGGTRLSLWSVTTTSLVCGDGTRLSLWSVAATRVVSGDGTRFSLWSVATTSLVWQLKWRARGSASRQSAAGTSRRSLDVM